MTGTVWFIYGACFALCILLAAAALYWPNLDQLIRAYRNWCNETSDGLDAAWDDVADLFIPVDELAARRRVGRYTP